MNHPVSRAATLPFHFLETQRIPCGYERSCKLERGNILANRYLLGINTADISQQQLRLIPQQLQMPDELSKPFLADSKGANLIFIGFEADAREGGLYKLYLEYWDKLRAMPGFPNINQSRFLLHRGYKWRFDQPEKQAITDYHFIPGLDSSQMLERIENRHHSEQGLPVLRAVHNIIELARQRAPGKQFIYVEVSETGNPRLSFDINLYPAGLRVGEVTAHLGLLAAELEIDPAKLERLLGVIHHRLLGHISAGMARNGAPYFTFYYEN